MFHGILHDFFLPVPYWPAHRSTTCKTFERDSFFQERFEMRKGRIGNTDRLYVQGMSTSKESKSIARTLSEIMAGFLNPLPLSCSFCSFLSSFLHSAFSTPCIRINTCTCAKFVCATRFQQCTVQPESCSPKTASQSHSRDCPCPWRHQ